MPVPAEQVGQDGRDGNDADGAVWAVFEAARHAATAWAASQPIASLGRGLTVFDAFTTHRLVAVGIYLLQEKP